MAIDGHKLDEVEEQLIQQFAQDGCNCDYGPNKTPCCTSISCEHFRSVHCQVAELTHDEQDIVVIDQVMVGCFAGDHTEGWREESPTQSLPSGSQDLSKDISVPP